MNYVALSQEIMCGKIESLSPYLNSRHKWMIGKEHNLSKKGLSIAQREYLGYSKDTQMKNFSDLRITKEQSLRLFKDDIDVCVNDLRFIFKDFDSYSEELQHIFIVLEFQFGYDSFRGIYDTIRLVKNGELKNAAIALRQSFIGQTHLSEYIDTLASRLENC